MRTFVYIDGLNLYNRCLRNKYPQCKWLDIVKFSEKMLRKNDEVVQVKFFTARIQQRPRDPSAPQRQETYLRALETLYPDKVTIIEGRFRSHNTPMPRTQPPHRMVNVIKTEEKGSDVNLSVHLLNDAWLDLYQCAIVVTNDSDMAGAMQLVRANHRNKKIGWINTAPDQLVNSLYENADFRKPIDGKALIDSQLPDVIQDGGPGKVIRKPTAW